MRRLAPYQLGLWLAEYIDIRCQLCGCYRRSPQPRSTLITDAPSATLALDSDLTTISSHTANLPSTPTNQDHHSKATLVNSLLCTRCHHSIAWLPAPFYVDVIASKTLAIQVATYYDYPIRQAIRSFKHSDDMTRLPLLVHLLRQLPRPKGCYANNSVILPMPTTDSRLIKRGFDPVTILSAYLSKHWQIPLWHGIQRRDDTLSQQGLSRAERLVNLNDAFVLTETPSVKRVLLFDDVATTGASLQALARALYPTDNLSSYDLSQTDTYLNATDKVQHSQTYHILAYTRTWQSNQLLRASNVINNLY